jgi:3-methyladenine DNA glycosylase AlkD
VSPVAATTVSSATARAQAFVEARLDRAAALGASLAELAADPDALAVALEEGLGELADSEYEEGQHFVAPGLGPTLGVRQPLLRAVTRAYNRQTRVDSPAVQLRVAERLLRGGPLEMRWLAFRLFDDLVRTEPERTWQLIRRAAREADDWITVDSLAHPAGRGILLEPYRWAELGQLVFAPSRWERRLVGSTVATIPFIDRRRGREPDVAELGIGLIGELIGDSEPDVQKALSWALRSMAVVDQAAVEAFCRREAAVAAASDDGHRAWVIRDTLSKLDETVATQVRGELEGIRRRPGTPATSTAATTAADFGGMVLGSSMPEPPLT